ncbi:MAG TPA: BadF/BadG/BcrA/BcrD ATPase family protein [bacterium]|nr:BadF/BadG/BcrA/BcrD ATPase family protein [bacterium]
MDYFLGVDGGASGTACAVASADGAVLGIGHAGPSNHILASGGRERARAAVRGAVGQALAAAGLGSVTFRAAQFGMTGITRDSEQARVFADVVRETLDAALVRIENDAVIARAGALAGRPGVIVIAGTGSVAFGEDPQGGQARAGGWGYIFGDEGSGFAIGCGGVRAALHARDGTGEPTVLVERLGETAGMSVADIPMAFYEGRVDRSRIAGLSRAVSRAAEERDAVAHRLIEEAAAALARLVAAVIARLRWPDGPVAVGPVGGVFEAGRTILGPLGEALARTTPQAVLVPPRLEPAAGAVLLAMRAAGLPLSPTVLALLAATWELRRGGAPAQGRPEYPTPP